MRVHACLLLSLILLIIGKSAAASLHSDLQFLELLEETTVLSRTNFTWSKALTEQVKIDSKKLSPNGKFIAFIESSRKISSLKFLDIASQEITTVFTSRHIQFLGWTKNSEQLVVSTRNKLAMVSAKEGSSPIILVALEKKKEHAFFGIASHLPAGFIVHKRNFAKNQYELWSVDMDGEQALLVASEHPILDYLIDEKNPSKIILKVFNTRSQAVQILMQPKDETINDKPSLTVIAHCFMVDSCQLISFDGLNNSLYLLASFDHDLAGLYQLNLSSAATNDKHTTFKRELIHSDPNARFDILNAMVSDSLPDIVMYDTHYRDYVGLSPHNEKKLEFIYSQLVEVTSKDRATLSLQKSDDNSVWLISDDSANSQKQSSSAAQRVSPTYILQESSNSLTLSKIFPSIEKRNRDTRLPSYRTAIDYTVSDGMQQFGYLTLPRGKSLANIPVVVLPHGGPWSRSNGAYDIFADFIASRGYAVLQPNFRASTGMGKHYVRSANKDFGDGRVQQDIMDALEFVLDSGIGDRENIAIVGHSFGGFSALAALSFTPDAFKFGFAGAPPSDLARSIEFLAAKDHRNRDQKRQLFLGELAADIDDKADMERSAKQSPHNNWTNIKRPLYIWAGKYDDRVDVKHVNEYASQLYQGQKRLFYFLDPKAGHSPQKGVSIDAYFYLMEASLSKHLGGKFEAEKSAELQRFLENNTKLNNLNDDRASKN